ncbi:MAG: hypothetical protein ACTSXT_13620 [Candidatus Helarchaeota archaeon]
MKLKQPNPVNITILTIPLFNKEEFFGTLPLPTKYNTGNFRFPASVNTDVNINVNTSVNYYMYSPVDLAVASLIKPAKRINNLKKWFRNNPKRPSENLIYITYKKDSNIYSQSISQIKSELFNLDEFKLIAPFTFT